MTEAMNPLQETGAAARAHDAPARGQAAPLAKERQRPPWQGRLGLAPDSPAERARVERFRRDTQRLDLELMEDLARDGRGKPIPPRRVLITGSSGLIGAELRALLSVMGHQPLSAVRRPVRAPDELSWDPDTGAVRATAPIDAVVHLAGEPLTSGRLDDSHLRRVRRSRVDGTRSLVAGLAALRPKPSVFIAASAIGYYGDRGAEALDEDSAAGRGLLAQLCADWEDAASAAVENGMRTAMVRFGIVLSPRGGALARQLPLFSAGLGGPLAGGRMFQPALAVDDAAAVLARALFDERVAGPVNAVPPDPVDNATFARTLGRVLGRPAFMPVPAPALRLAIGRLAEEAVLASTRVLPKRLRELGHRFRHHDLEAALRHVLGRVASGG